MKKLTKKIGVTKAELNIPALRYYGILRVLGKFLSWKGIDHYKGYASFNRVWDGSEFDKISSGDSIVVHQEPEIVTLFDSFLDECKQNDVQVILVFTPQYIKRTEFTKNWDGEMQLYRDAELFTLKLANDIKAQNLTVFHSN